MDIYQVPGDQQLQSISMWLLFYFQFVEILFPLHGTYSQGVNSKKYLMRISRLGCLWFIKKKSGRSVIVNFKGCYRGGAVASSIELVTIETGNTVTPPPISHKWHWYTRKQISFKKGSIFAVSMVDSGGQSLAKSLCALCKLVQTVVTVFRSYWQRSTGTVPTGLPDGRIVFENLLECPERTDIW